MTNNLPSRDPYHRVQLILIAMSVFLLSACGSGSDSVSLPVLVADSPPAVTTVDGGVTKGPVAEAAINVYAVDNNGQKTGDPTATSTTDANGQYTIQLTDFVGVYIVEATGGSYLDEATGTTKSIPSAAPLRAVSTIDSSSSATVTASVTPLTEIATQVAQQKPGGLTADNVTTGNNEVGALFFGTSEGAGNKLLTTVPADITSEDSATASDDERLYGLMLAAISQLEANTGSLSEAVTAIANDIAADGDLSDSSDDLVAAVNTIVSGATNNSGVTSATKVTNILTAAATGPETEVALSSDADITAFKFDDTLETTIDKQALTVAVLQPAGTDAAGLADPTIAISLGATFEPEDGEDFTDAVSYIVTAEDGTSVTWAVTVTVATSEASPLARITGPASERITSIVINNTTRVVVGGVGSLDDLAALDQVTDPTTIFTISAGATVETQSGSGYQLGEVSYIITAEDGTTVRQWAVQLRVNDPQPQPAFSITNGDLELLVTSSPVQLETAGGLPEAALGYTSSNTNIVTVGTEGLLTVAGAGTATVSARKGRVVTPVVEYLSATATITVTVDKLAQSTLSFAQATVSVTTDGSVSNVLSGGSGTGQVTYSSSATSVATVAANGSVTLIGTGTTTISAVKAGDDTYLESNTASYTLTVTEAGAGEPTTTCVFDQSSWDECDID